MAYDFNSLTKQADEAINRNKFYTDFEDVDPNTLHQISELTEWMRTKAKGSDVREVIAQLFERVMLDGAREGNANLEVSVARGNFPTLSARLEDFLNQLKALASGGPKGTYANLSALQTAKSNGDSGIYVTTDNGHWYYYNDGWKDGGIYQNSAIGDKEILTNMIADGAVAIDKTGFIDFDINDDLTKFGTVDSANASGPSYQAPSVSNKSIYVSVDPSTTYYIYKKLGTTFRVAFTESAPQPGLAFITDTKKTLDGENYAAVITPNTAKFMVVWFYNSDTESGYTPEQILAAMQILKTKDAATLNQVVKVTADNLDESLKTMLAVKEEDASAALISSYTAIVNNNIAINRNGEVAHVKIKFDEGEVKQAENLKVSVDGAYVEFEWMPNTSEENDGTLRDHVYADGSLKAGEVVFVTDFTANQSKTIKVEVYDRPVTNFDSANITVAVNEASEASITSAKLSATITAQYGYMLRTLNFNGTALTSQSSLERSAVQLQSGAVFFNNHGLTRFAQYGSGKVFKRLVYEFPTDLDGVSMICIYTFYANNTIDVKKRYVFNGFKQEITGTRERLYFQSSDFASKQLAYNEVADTTKSFGGMLGSTAGLVSTITIQTIPNAGGDGFGGKYMELVGKTGVGGSNPDSFLAISINDARPSNPYVPADCDAIGYHYVYSFYDDSLENSEHRNFNPIYNQATKLLYHKAKAKLKEQISDYIINNYDKASSYTYLRAGRLAIMIAYAKITDNLDNMMDSINAQFDALMTYYGTVDKIWDLFKNGRGIEFAGRDSILLGTIRKFYEARNDTDRVEQIDGLIKRFVEFYVMVEDHSGGSGAIVLGYTATDTMNSEAAALATMWYAHNRGWLTPEQEVVFQRMDSHFNSLMRQTNISPYSPNFNYTWQYKFHYHAFSLYDYVWNLPTLPEFSPTSYMDMLVNPAGKVLEYDANFQSSRRGTHHGTFYCIGMCLVENTVSTIATANVLMDDLMTNIYPDFSVKFPIGVWETPEAGDENNYVQNLAIANAVASQILLEKL